MTNEWTRVLLATDISLFVDEHFEAVSAAWREGLRTGEPLRLDHYDPDGDGDQAWLVNPRYIVAVSQAQ